MHALRVNLMSQRACLGRCVVGVVMTALVLLVSATVSRAEIEPAVVEAVCVRGEPVFIEVRVGVDASIGGLEFSKRGGESRNSIEGRLYWPYLPAPTEGALVRWAAPSNPLRLSETRPIGAKSALLVVTIPPSAAEELLLFVGGRAVALRVFEPGAADMFDQLAKRAGLIAPQGEREASLSLPDAAAPFERFRFSIGVPMRGWPEPPPFKEGSGDELAARASTALWRAALSRVAAGGIGPATELAEQLVASCSDETAPAPIAAWIASPEELRSVLNLAFEREFSPARVAASVNEFVHVRAPVLWWIEDSDRLTVTLAMANPTTHARLVQYQWLAGSETDLLPLVVEVPAAEVRRARIERAAVVRSAFAAGQPDAIERLQVSCEGHAENLQVSPGMIRVPGGGLTLSECFAPLNLVSVARDGRGAMRLSTTRIAVRERLTGWELFLDVGGVDGDDAVAAQEHALWTVGSDGGSVRVDGSGAVTILESSLGAEAVEFAAFPERFRAATVFPSEWIRREEGTTILQVGFRRLFPGGFADAPFATVPWRTRPRTIELELSP